VLGRVTDWQQETRGGLNVKDDSSPNRLTRNPFSRSEVMKQNRIFVFLAALVVAASFAIWAGSNTNVQAEEGQPHMQSALHHLHEAQEELRAAEHDKGGHRANAIKLVDQAISEVDAGIHYADKH
jgi:hypothetical protein